MSGQVIQHHTSSTGHTMATTEWLDAHFEACRPEYEAGLRFMGIQPGWAVLDAGCGGGNYLPWLADLVGPTGRIAALDLAEENIAAVNERVGAWGLPCPLEARVGDIFALPYADGSLDAVWCANVSQYLNDEQFGRVLREFRRVVRPGGLVAVKEFDTYQVRMLPAPVALFWRYAQHWMAEDGSIRGGWSSTELAACLRRTGLGEIRQRTFLIERFAPLTEVERRYISDVAAGFGRFAQTLAGTATSPAEERATWLDLARGDYPNSRLDHPDFYWCEGSVVAVGRVPG